MSERLRRLVAFAVAVGIASGALVALPAGADVPTGGTWSSEVRYEAESNPGTVGANSSFASCSGGARRGTSLTTGTLMSFSITVPAGATHAIVGFMGASNGTRDGLIDVTGTGGGTGIAYTTSPKNLDTTLGCQGFTQPDSGNHSVAYYALSEGQHTVSITAGAGTNSLTIDYALVFYWTPPATTTTAGPTTTTAPVAWTGQSRPAGLLDDTGVAALGLAIALAAGAVFGRSIWGGGR